MVLQLDFKCPYHNIRMRLGKALVVCDLQCHFSAFWLLFIVKGRGVPKLFWVKKNPLFTFSELDFSALKLLNGHVHKYQTQFRAVSRA